jgi:L-Ala-D/L-Glu epimerase
MKLRYHPFELKLRHTFTIARGSRDTNQIVFVELEHDGITGYGEAAPAMRYGESTDSVIEFIKKVDLEKISNPFHIERNVRYLESLSQKDYSARTAIDTAMYDWVGKALDVPLHKLWGLSAEDTPKTSFTIGIDRPDVLKQKIREAEQYPLLKIKLGGENDEEIMKTVRSVTEKVLRVDANEGWKLREIALEKILWLQSQGVEFIEQPMPADQLLDTAWVRERVSIPLIADENVVTMYDVPKLRGAFDGINIKLMKCGGLHNALKMIYTAKSMNMKVMMGCMVESSVAISAAAQLSPLLDYADLDGNLLITNDPFMGVTVREGQIYLQDKPGIGVTSKGDI